MKFKILTLVSLALLALAGCGKPTSQNVSASDSATLNDVNVTAPDAEAKKQQGYILPGLDHGFEQSPIKSYIWNEYRPANSIFKTGVVYSLKK